MKDDLNDDHLFLNTSADYHGDKSKNSDAAKWVKDNFSTEWGAELRKKINNYQAVQRQVVPAVLSIINFIESVLIENNRKISQQQHANDPKCSTRALSRNFIVQIIHRNRNRTTNFSG